MKKKFCVYRVGRGSGIIQELQIKRLQKTLCLRRFLATMFTQFVNISSSALAPLGFQRSRDRSLVQAIFRTIWQYITSSHLYVPLLFISLMFETPPSSLFVCDDLDYFGLCHVTSEICTDAFENFLTLSRRPTQCKTRTPIMPCFSFFFFFYLNGI